MNEGNEWFVVTAGSLHGGLAFVWSGRMYEIKC